MTWQVLAAVVAALATASLYATIAILLGRRHVTGDAAHAMTLFRAWWVALALNHLLTPVTFYLHSAGRLPPWLYETLRETTFFLITVALWALLCYLVFLYSGSRRSWPWLAGAYFVLYVALMSFVNAYVDPTRLAHTGWAIQPATPATLEPAAGIVLLMLLLGPQLAASLAYLALVRVADDATTRYRIVMVASGILLWFGTTLVAGIAGAQGDAWQVTSRILGILGAVLTLLAYFPPRGWRKRWGLRALGAEPSVAAAAGQRLAAPA